ncbi:MAG: penicillin-binding transpeptidase domain-containing protein [Bacillota bacterium]|nr:penicillin-binding transpeptidase domain-containing protein [Bacillota bacterium]
MKKGGRPGRGAPVRLLRRAGRGASRTDPKERREQEQARRARALWLLTLAALFALAGRLAWMQGVEAERWRSMSQAQVFREVQTPAPRGEIVDRNGTVLATSRGVWAALLAYTQEPPSPASIRLLASILQLDPAAIEKAIQQQRSARGIPYQPIRLKLGLTAREWTLLREYQDQLPGVQVAIEPVRVYPGAPGDPLVGGTLAANVLGYVQPDPHQDPREAPRLVGFSGLEQSMNQYLQGRPGIDLVQVDAAGRPIQVFSSTAPVQGDTLVLTLDAHVQEVAQRALAQEVQKLNQAPPPSGCDGIRADCYPQRAAAVVLDVRTGAIVAMASYPTFDPNVWARVASRMADTESSPDAKQIEAWLHDKNGILTDHSRQTPRSPGSTFKPVTAMAALASGVVTPNTLVYDPGYLRYGSFFGKNWTYPAAGGWMNMVQALARSDNVYFWTLAERLRWQDLAEMAHQFGMGVPSGLRELQTKTGTVTTPATLAKFQPGQPWTQGQVLNAAIGQGVSQFTTLEMAQMAAIIANGGIRYRPYVVSEIRTPDGHLVRKTEPQVLGRVDAPASDFQVVREGMLAVNSYNPNFRGTSPVGLAYSTFGNFPQKSAARSGHGRLPARDGTAGPARRAAGGRDGAGHGRDDGDRQRHGPAAAAGRRQPGQLVDRWRFDGKRNFRRRQPVASRYPWPPRADAKSPSPTRLDRRGPARGAGGGGVAQKLLPGVESADGGRSRHQRPLDPGGSLDPARRAGGSGGSAPAAGGTDRTFGTGPAG